MIYLDTATADWEGVDGWKIAPAGLAWIGEGFRLKHGNYCRLGDNCQLGDDCRLGNRCRLGDHAQDPIDIGCVDGYRKTLSHVKNVAYVGAGCQWLTLSAALDHWAGRKDRVLTRCLMAAAVSIAEQKGWSGK